MTTPVLDNKSNVKSSERGQQREGVRKDLLDRQIRSPFNVWSIMDGVGISDLKNKPKYTKPLQFS